MVLEKVISDNGEQIDATFSVESSDGKFNLVFESRGPSRNTQYGLGLTLLLERLARLNAILIDAVVISRETKDLPVEQRRIEPMASTIYPAILRDVRDVDQFRKDLGRAQQEIGRTGGSKGGGNSTKRIQLVIELPTNMSAADLQGRLRGVLGGVSDKSNEYEPDEEEAAFEGQMQEQFRKHRKREQKKRNEKIKSFKRDHEGRVYCEVPNCGTDFERQYGVIGQDFAHVHHLDPLGKSGDDGTETRLADLAVVCPNCHAMIHRHGKTRTLEEVGTAIAERKLKRRGLHNHWSEA